jgi:hypothetical protein
MYINKLILKKNLKKSKKNLKKLKKFKKEI